MALFLQQFFAKPHVEPGKVHLSWFLPDAEVVGDGYGQGYYGWCAYGGPVRTGEWNGRLLVLKKQFAFPTDPADADAIVIFDDTYIPPFSTDLQVLLDDGTEQGVAGLPEGVMYYYTAFTKDADDEWVPLDLRYSIAYSFAAGEWGFAKWMYETHLPEFMNADDSEGHLEAFLKIIGYGMEIYKTEIEQLQYLFDSLYVPIHLLPNLMHMLGLKDVDSEMGVLNCRQLINDAPERFSKRGRLDQIKELFEIVADGWELSYKEFWTNVLFAGDPDTHLPNLTGDGDNLRQKMGSLDDELFYVNGGDTARAVNGVLFQVSYVGLDIGDSGFAIRRWIGLLVDWNMWYVRTGLVVDPDTQSLGETPLEEPELGFAETLAEDDWLISEDFI